MTMTAKSENTDRNAVETAASDVAPLAVTGERFHPENLGEIRQEHMHRYAWCVDMVADKSVVDIASGEGFGSAMLADTASHVAGIDRDERAVAHARQRYHGRPNLAYECADAAATGLPDKCADVVVSFETIEHVDDQAGMIGEIDRILRDDGFLVISSPNRTIYSDRQHHSNPFHTRELDEEEFLRLLGERFAVVRLYGQRLTVASALLPDTPTTDPVTLYLDRDEPVKLSHKLPSTMYFVAVAARNADALPETTPSMLVSENADVYWHMRDDIALRQGALRMIMASTQRWFHPGFYRTQGGRGDGDEALFADYLTRGEALGLRPCADFDPAFYFADNPDVLAAGQSALMHFVFYGEREGRHPLARG